MVRGISALSVVLILAAQVPGETAQSLFRRGSTEYVGIQYWLQTEDGTRVTEAAAHPNARYELHMRCNVAGFLTVYLIDGAELTSMSSPPYAGLELKAGGWFKAPGTFRLTGGKAGMVFLFARSQSEQVRTADEGLAKLERLRAALVSGTVSEGADLGTYVVNSQGNQPAGTIRLVR